MAFDCIKVKFPNLEDQNKWHTDEIPFIKNYLEIIKNRIHEVKTSHFWLIASFVKFDDGLLDYIPEQFEKDQMHVFYSGANKEGNIFLIPKQKFLEQIDELKFLRDFKDINYHETKLGYSVLKKNILFS